MKLHFAAELVLEVINQLFKTPEKIWANITSENARIDFFREGNIAEIFPQIVEKVDALIQANLPIVSAFSDEEAERRYWEIEGFARVPCG
jgi:Ser-tRNA(Ala) deacylase AlaX